jgi:hypothetical protein
MSTNNFLRNAEAFQNLLVSRATGEMVDPLEYKQLREVLLSNKTNNYLLPRFIRTCRDLSQFWSFIQAKFPTYQERRIYLWEEFSHLFEELELSQANPPDLDVAETLSKLETHRIKEIWDIALSRRTEDPEGAITSARALIESVCKSILEDAGVSYTNQDDLPKLYKMTAEILNIAPSNHTDLVFKQILGGCTSVVHGLASLRNKLGDAHGPGKRPVKPSPRHAELAVNLAGSMALFLVNTRESNKKKRKIIE